MKPIAQIQIRRYNAWERYENAYSQEQADSSLCSLRANHPTWDLRIVYADESGFVSGGLTIARVAS